MVVLATSFHLVGCLVLWAYLSFLALPCLWPFSAVGGWVLGGKKRGREGPPPPPPPPSSLSSSFLYSSSISVKRLCLCSTPSSVAPPWFLRLALVASFVLDPSPFDLRSRLFVLGSRPSSLAHGSSFAALRPWSGSGRYLCSRGFRFWLALSGLASRSLFSVRAFAVVSWGLVACAFVAQFVAWFRCSACRVPAFVARFVACLPSLLGLSRAAFVTL